MKYFRVNSYLFIASFLIVGLLTNCKKASDKTESTASEIETKVEQKLPYNVEDPKGLMLAVSEACGGIDKLKSLKDVEYDYNYVSPDGKKDASKERYIFENEISWAKYSKHEINVSPDLEGTIVQFYDGKNISVYNNSEPLSDPAILVTGQFLRQANYMWFNMMFKLNDPGIIYKYEGQEEIEGTNFDKVLVTYDPAVTGKEQNDTFILYINPENRMVESFYFSLPAFGVLEPVLHAKLTYTEIDGVQVITKRLMSAPSPDGSGMVPLVDQELKNVKFNNGFTSEQLGKDI